MLYILTLDIDDKNKINEVLSFLKEKKNIRNVLVRESSTKGYHVKVFIEYDEKLIDEIRSKFDDKIRYYLDKEIIHKPKNVLFDLKVIDNVMYKAKSFRKP